jgi:hypothetical protein
MYHLRMYSLSLESVTLPSTTYPLPRERASVVEVVLTVSFPLSLPTRLSTAVGLKIRKKTLGLRSLLCVSLSNLPHPLRALRVPSCRQCFTITTVRVFLLFPLFFEQSHLSAAHAALSIITPTTSACARPGARAKFALVRVDRFTIAMIAASRLCNRSLRACTCSVFAGAG